MTRTPLIASIAVASLLLAACAGGGGTSGGGGGAAASGGADDAGSPAAATSGATGAGATAGGNGGGAGKPVEIDLAAENNSGVSGTATLTDLGNGKLRVDINVEAAGNNAMPAHIHPGSCAELDPKPRYPLSDVENGTSTTEVDATLADVQTGACAINLHKLTEDLKTDTACGNIPKA